MSTGLLAFLTMMPRLLAIMESIGSWLITTEASKWISDLENHTDKLQNAKTSQDRLDALHGFLSTVRTIR